MCVCVCVRGGRIFWREGCAGRRVVIEEEGGGEEGEGSMLRSNVVEEWRGGYLHADTNGAVSLNFYGEKLFFSIPVKL